MGGSVALGQCKSLCDADSNCLGIMTQSSSYYAWATANKQTPITSCYLCPSSLNGWSRNDGSQAVYWKQAAIGQSSNLVEVDHQVVRQAQHEVSERKQEVAPDLEYHVMKQVKNYDEQQGKNCLQGGMEHGAFNQGSVALGQ